MMLQSKQGLVGGSIIGVFLLVYGSAIAFRVLVGEYMLEGGLTNLSYSYLALLCALPFVLEGLTRSNNGQKKYFNTIVMSGVLFAILFVVIHWAFVYSGEQLTDDAIRRMLIVFPISALLIVVAIRIALMGRESR